MVGYSSGRRGSTANALGSATVAGVQIPLLPPTKVTLPNVYQSIFQHILYLALI